MQSDLQIENYTTNSQHPQIYTRTPNLVIIWREDLIHHEIRIHSTRSSATQLPLRVHKTNRDSVHWQKNTPIRTTLFLPRKCSVHDGELWPRCAVKEGLPFYRFSFAFYTASLYMSRLRCFFFSSSSALCSASASCVALVWTCLMRSNYDWLLQPREVILAVVNTRSLPS